MPQAKTEVALQFSECCAAEAALQHSLFCNADTIFTQSCTATSEKLHCNIDKAALQESGALLPLSCRFQAPTFRHPRFGLAETSLHSRHRKTGVEHLRTKGFHQKKTLNHENPYSARIPKHDGGQRSAPSNSQTQCHSTAILKL